MAGKVRKRRRTTVHLGNCRSFAALRQNGSVTGTPLVDTTIPVNVVQDQVTDSEGHRWPIHLKLGELKLWDVGGTFKTTNSFLSDQAGKPIDGFNQQGWTVRNGGLGSAIGNYEFYRGPVLPVDCRGAGSYFPLESPTSDQEMDTLGTTAIALCKPTNPVSNVFTALGETYRDGLPSLIGANSWRARTLRAKEAGSEYLNVQFGWAPLVSDVMKFVDATQNTEKYLRQFERDAGKIVRRRFHFPKVETSEEVVVSSTAAPFGPQGSALVTTTGKLVRHRVTKREQWFSGAFTYFIPTGDDYRSKMMRLAAETRKLYGSPLDPSTLWQLAPWSWALDWFSNTGDVIANLEDFKLHGLVLRYGYIMETTTVIDTYHLSGFSRRISGDSSPRKEETSLSFCTVSKKRRRATPFGFGLNWDGLSPFQLSIIAALGMTRGGR